MDEQQLTDLFARLGAPEPATSAHSQITEGIPQLSRFLFLRQAWKSVVPEDDSTWIRAEERVDPNGPGGGIVPALARLKALGADEADITTIVRVMQSQLLFNLCYLFEDPGDLEDEVKHIAWRLFQVDSNDRPIEIIGALHEDVLATEPGGREMRPR